MVFLKEFRVICIILLAMFAFKAQAQEPNFSMYHYSPIYTNPGQIGVEEDVRLMLNYRNQSIDVGDSFRASSLSGFYPLNVGNHRLVFAASFLNDRASEFVTTNGGVLGVAYSIKTSATNELSFGLQGGYFQRRTDDDFITDDQFVNGALDPNAPSADGVLNRSKGYPTVSGGLYYQVKDEEGREKAFIGGSLYNIVEPDVSFLDAGDDDLPMSLKATAGYRVYQGQRFSVMPTARLINQLDNNFLNLGSRFGYELDNTDEGVKKIELGVWYNTNDLGVFSIAYEQPNLTLGVSYDLPVGSDLTSVNNGIFELAVSFRLKKKSKSYAPKSSANTQTPGAEVVSDNQTVNDDESSEEVAPDENEDQNEAADEKVEEAQEEISDPVKDNSQLQEEPEAEEKVAGAALTVEEKEILAKTVRFDFNTDNLDQESRVFLDRVAKILNQKQGLNVELIGHSCDIGPEHINEELSHKRAESVKGYLVNKGVSSDRFLIKGMGESEPSKSNDTEAGRVHNRRVEFRAFEK